MKTVIYSKQAPEPIGPYSQAIKAGDFLYVSGQIPIDPQTNELKMVSVQDETLQVMKNIQAVLAEAGYDFSDIIKTTIFLSDMALFAEVNQCYAAYFKQDAPARECVAVAGLPKNVNVEISVIAYKE